MQPKLKHSYVAVCVAALALTATVQAQQILVPEHHSWNYLHPMGTLPPRPVDLTPDPDFETTWYLSQANFAATYDGPRFDAATTGNPAVLDSADSGPGFGPFAYGVVDSIPVPAVSDATGTALTVPNSNNRLTSYYRTTFTVPAGGLIEPTIRISCDDGGFLYLDGNLIATINITDGVTDTYAAVATDANNTEVNPTGIFTFHLRSTGAQAGAEPGDVKVLAAVPSLTAGEHTLAMSVHNNSITSSDMGLLLELSALDPTAVTLHPVVSDIVRNLQGTPLDQNDDTFTFKVNITGANTSASWNADNPFGATGPYGVTTTMGPYSALAPAQVIFTDSVNATGTATVTVTPPSAATALVNYNHSWKVMNPQGGVLPAKPAGGADADFESTWFLKESDFITLYDGPNFGANPGADYQAVTGAGPFAAGGVDGIAAGQPSGAAGTPLTLPPTNNRRTSYYRTTFTTTLPMSVLALDLICDDGVYIYLDGVLVAQENMVTFPAAPAPGFNALALAARTETAYITIDLSQPPGFNVITSVSGLAPGTHTLAVSLHQNSVTSSDVGVGLKLSGIESVGIPVIQASAGPAVRSDAGTPANPLDDTFTFQATVTGSNAGATWNSDSIPASGNYDVATTFGPYPVSGGPATVTFSASADPNVKSTVTVTPPATTLTAIAGTPVRQNSGTPSDPRDDTFTVPVTASGNWLSPSWTSNQVPAAGSYGVATVFGPFPATGAPVTITITDSVVTTATVSVTVRPPRYVPALELIPYSQSWQVMNPTAGTIPNGPGGPDADFETTWYLKEDFFTVIYNGPTFGSGGVAGSYEAITGPGPFAVGGIDGLAANTTIGPAGTTITLPATDLRFTSYYRTTFTVAADVHALKIDTLYDDALYIYLDGTLIAQTNTTVADQFAGFATNAHDENLITTIDLGAPPGGEVVATVPSLTAGTHTLAVSMHQNSATSSDVGFALTLYGRLATTPVLSAVPGAVTRNYNNTVSPADDSFSFPMTITAVNGGPSWNSNSVPASGPYGVETAFGPFPVSQAPKSIVFSDPADPQFSAILTNTALPDIFGMSNLGGTVSPILPQLPIPANWTANPSNISHSTNVGVAAPGSVILSDLVNLSAVAGPIQFRMDLNLSDTSATSNFEIGDTVLVELVLNDGVADQRVNLIAPFDTNLDGVLNGFTGADAAAYNAGKAQDELNGAKVNAEASANFTFALSHVIPDNILSAQVVVTVVDIGGTESVTISNVTFTPATGEVDSDGDGQSDASEGVAGTNPADPKDVLRITGISAAGNGANVTFPTKVGKNYQAEVTNGLNGLNGWAPLGGVIPGTGGDITANIPLVPIPGEKRYFLRVHVVP